MYHPSLRVKDSGVIRQLGWLLYDFSPNLSFIYSDGLYIFINSIPAAQMQASLAPIIDYIEMLKSSKDNAAEQLQVGEIPPKPALNPLFRLDCQAKTRPSTPLPAEGTPSNPITNVAIHTADVVAAVMPAHSRRDDALCRSRSRSREQKALKMMNVKKRSSESQSEKDQVRGVERSKYRSKNDVSFSKRSSARLQERAAPKIQSIQQASKTPTAKSKLSVLETSHPISGTSTSEKKEDSTYNILVDKFYKTRICPQFLNGYCDREGKCTYAHGEKEVRQFQGTCFKTKICYSFTQGRCTKRSEQCKYAHGASDLRGKQASQRIQTKMDVQEKKSYSPQAHLKASKKGKVQPNGNKDFNKDNYQHKRRGNNNKAVDSRKMQQQSNDRQILQREKQRAAQKSFLQRQKNRQRKQFSNQSSQSSFQRPEYFGNNFAQQRQPSNTFRTQYQNMPVYGQPIMQPYPVNPQLLNYPIHQIHNYLMQMQMLQYMPQQPVNYYHQYPNYQNGMQPFEYRQFTQPSYPAANANYHRGNNQVKKQQANIPIIDKKSGKSKEKNLDY